MKFFAKTWVHFSLVAGLMVAVTDTANAATPAYCAPTDDMDPLALLRQTSLDLRGRIPSFDEYERVLSATDPEAEVDTIVAEMLTSEDYFTQIRGYHRGLLWSSLDRSILESPYPTQRLLTPDGRGIWRIFNMRTVYRGRLDVECLDQQQTDFDADGRPTAINTFADVTCDGGQCQQEGWVYVTPYWDPSTPIRVCAYDAQAVATGADGVACDNFHVDDPGCGCGPNAELCGPNDLGLDLIRPALAEEPARIFEAVVREGRSYFDAFTTRDTYMNGPAAHYYRYNTGTTSFLTGAAAVAYESDIARGSVPDLPYAQVDQWVRVQRGPAHAGAFTTLAYLIRFASNRARANQFFTQFMCSPFVPSQDGLPADEDAPSPNLRERTGCSDCHQVLEPAASHWGRWRNGGTYGWMSPEVFDFSTPRPACLCGEGVGNNCSLVCSTFYVTADNASPEEYEQFGGLPQAAAWLLDSDFANVETGPQGLVDTPEEQAQVAQCAVRQMSEHLLGRGLEADDLQWLAEQTEAFAASGYDYTAMVHALVTDARYRTVR